jgi:hypothetical protein
VESKLIIERQPSTALEDRLAGRAEAPARGEAGRPRITVILPRGEAIRNFVHTGALDALKDEAELNVLSVLPTPDYQRLLADRFGHALPLEPYGERWAARITRDILDLAHNRWLWSGAAQERWRLRDAEAKTLPRKAQRVLKKLACYPFANRAGLDLLSRAERTISRLARTTDHYLNLFRRLRPDLVFNGSHAHSVIATQAVQAAQWLGITTATFVFSWDNLTSQGRIMLPYDYYFVWNEAIRAQLLDIYRRVRPEQVIVTGTPQFDSHFNPDYYWTREEFCARVGADPGRPIVFYSTGMPNHVPGEPRIVENIAAMIREMPAAPRPQLLVRVSPKDLTGRFDELKRHCPDVLFPVVPWEAAWLTPKIEDNYLLVNSLRHAAVGVNVGSTISLELCMFDKPVINVGYNPPGLDISPVDIPRYYCFDHYRPIVASGAVMLANSEGEMRELLQRTLDEPDCNRAQRRRLIREMFGETLDGAAGRRVTAWLLHLAGEQRGRGAGGRAAGFCCSA